MDTEEFRVDFDKCIEALKEDLSQIRTGRATPELIEDIPVEAYNTKAPLKNYANITLSDAKSLVVTPWDKSIIDNIAKAISDANMGFSAIVEGDHVRVIMPDLTEERRKEYVKIMKDRTEDARVAIRNVRQKYMKEIDEFQEAGASEDSADRLREILEKMVKEYNEKVEELREKKKKDLMTI